MHKFIMKHYVQTQYFDLQAAHIFEAKYCDLLYPTTLNFTTELSSWFPMNFFNMNLELMGPVKTTCNSELKMNAYKLGQY